ncbi:MAG: hypothetical protein IJO33_02785 [Bacilli bacterium]|nr:hypothetical protein [Bacilli bacterium]
MKFEAKDGKYQVAKNAHHNLKQKLGKSVLSKTNSLNYQYDNGKILINSKEKRV